MERLLASLSRFAGRRPWLVVAVWVALLAVAAPIAGRVADELSNGGFEVPGSQSVRLIAFLDDQSNGAQPFTFVVHTAQGGQASTQLQPVLARVARDFPQITLAPQPCAGGVAPVCTSGDGRTASVTGYAAVTQNEALELAARLKAAVQEPSGDVQVYVLGPGAVYDTFQKVTTDDIAAAESIGLPIVLIVLVVLFGALVAAVLPLAMGLISVVVTLAFVTLIASETEVSIYAQSMVSMIGLGVAVDYSLFVLARFREELALGVPKAAAVERAMRTSGTAVVFSGLTVIISLGTIWLVPVRAVQSMAGAAMLVVAVAVVAAATMLPALLHLLGARVNAVPIRIPGRRRRTEASTSFWVSFSQRIMGRPVLFFTLAATFLIVLSLPALAMTTANTSLDQLPKDEPVVRGSQILERDVTGPGRGREGALFVVAQPRDGSGGTVSAGALDGLRATIAARPEVQSAAVQRVGDGLEIVAPLKVDPESDVAVNTLVPAVRSAVVASGLSHDLDVVVGGVPAFNRDLNEEVGGDLFRVIVAVLVLAYLLLLLLLRSVLLPLKAVIMNLLSIGAAYGVLVAVFQWGWLDWTGFDSLGSIGTLTPPLVLAITFGLSMDYEVFLLLRIKERYEEHGDNARAVAEGLANSARIITSAAVIMVVVFGSFVLTSVPAIKEIGLGLAVAIAIDATVTRLVLVPATMRLLGDWNWWLPAWLDRLLPNLAHEAPARPPAAPVHQTP